MHRVCYSILSADAVLQDVSHAYGLDSTLACHLLRRGLHDTYLLSTRESRYVVRVHGTRQRTESDLGYEMELLAHLGTHGVSVAGAVPDRNGNLWRTLDAPEGSRRLVLLPYTEGEPLSWNNQEHCYLAGKLLASIHTASDNFQSKYTRYCLDLSYLIDAPLAAVRPFLAHRPEDWTFLERFAGKLRAQAEDDICSGLDWGVCHGDWSSGRIQISSGPALTALDFDQCGLGWRAYDLAAIHWLASGDQSGQIWNSFIRGYTESRPVNAVDLAAVPVFHVACRLVMLGFYGANASRWGLLRLNTQLDRELAFFRTWETTRATEERWKPSFDGTDTTQHVQSPRHMTMAMDGNPSRSAAVEEPSESPAGPSELFPVTHSILSCEAVGAAVERAYSLKEPISCLLLKQSLNDTYLLIAGGQRYIVRVYGSRWRTPSDVAYELELIRHLIKKGVSVASPLVTHSGALSCTLTAAEGPRQLAVFTYAPGTALSWKEESHSYQAGQMAASIHAASDDFVTPHARFRLDLTYMIDSPLAKVRPFFTEHPDDWQYLQEFAARLHTWASAAASNGLDWGPCHGDFGDKNVHLAADGTVTVLDFDLCAPGWRMYDLAPVYRAAHQQRRNTIWDAFLQGYTAIRSIAAADLRAVPLFRALRHLAMFGVFAENVAEWGIVTLSSQKLGGYIAFFREWEAEYLGGVRDGSNS